MCLNFSFYKIKFIITKWFWNYKKEVQNVWNIFWFLIIHIGAQKYFHELIFIEFMGIYFDVLKVFKNILFTVQYIRTVRQPRVLSTADTYVHRAEYNSAVNILSCRQRASTELSGGSVCRQPRTAINRYLAETED